MANYPRTTEGFASALAAAKSVAKMHPDKDYVLYVDYRNPTVYGVTMRSLFDHSTVLDGTAACVIDAEGNMTTI